MLARMDHAATPQADPAQLIRDLDAFDLDAAAVDPSKISPGAPPPEFTFTQRLARENGWSEAFAARVIREYKRFVALCMLAGHPCTPSEHVDQAWHLHLTFTRSYWEHMCQGVLGRPLHHNPTKGGDAEQDKFDDWYARTLESYRSLFNEEPPADIWTPADQRFGHDLRWERVNLADNFVIPRRFVRTAVLGLLLVLGVGFVVAGCVAQTAPAQPTTQNTGIDWVSLIIGGSILLVVLVLAIKFRRHGGGDWGGCGFGGCGGGGCGGGCGGGGCGS